MTTIFSIGRGTVGHTYTEVFCTLVWVQKRGMLRYKFKRSSTDTGNLTKSVI